MLALLISHTKMVHFNAMVMPVTSTKPISQTIYATSDTEICTSNNNTKLYLHMTVLTTTTTDVTVMSRNGRI